MRFLICQWKFLVEGVLGFGCEHAPRVFSYSTIKVFLILNNGNNFYGNMSNYEDILMLILPDRLR